MEIRCNYILYCIDVPTNRCYIYTVHSSGCSVKWLGCKHIVYCSAEPTTLAHTYTIQSAGRRSHVGRSGRNSDKKAPTAWDSRYICQSPHHTFQKDDKNTSVCNLNPSTDRDMVNCNLHQRNLVYNDTLLVLCKFHQFCRHQPPHRLQLCTLALPVSNLGSTPAPW